MAPKRNRNRRADTDTDADTAPAEQLAGPAIAKLTEIMTAQMILDDQTHRMKDDIDRLVAAACMTSWCDEIIDQSSPGIEMLRASYAEIQIPPPSADASSAGGGGQRLRAAGHLGYCVVQNIKDVLGAPNLEVVGKACMIRCLMLIFGDSIGIAGFARPPIESRQDVDAYYNAVEKDIRVKYYEFKLGVLRRSWSLERLRRSRFLFREPTPMEAEWLRNHDTPTMVQRSDGPPQPFVPPPADASSAGGGGGQPSADASSAVGGGFVPFAGTGRRLIAEETAAPLPKEETPVPKEETPEPVPKEETPEPVPKEETPEPAAEQKDDNEESKVIWSIVQTETEGITDPIEWKLVYDAVMAEMGLLGEDNYTIGLSNYMHIQVDIDNTQYLEGMD